VGGWSAPPPGEEELGPQNSDDGADQRAGTKENPPLFRQAVGSLRWSFGSSALTLVLQLGYTATVSRVVAPKAFGLFALGGLLLRFVSYFAQLGLGSAVVQRPNLDEDDIRVAFTASCVLGVAVFGLAWILAPICAPLISKDPGLVPVARALSGTFLFSAFGVTAQAVLCRNFRFRVLALVDIGAFIVGYLAVGLPSALAGAGVWSLVAAALTSAAITTGTQVYFASHPMRPHMDLVRLWALARFGGAVSVIGFFEFIGSTLDTLAVGRFAGSVAVGNYTRATALVTPVERFATATSEVLYPNFARIGSDRERTATAYLSGLALITAVILPPAACLAAAAPDVVRVLLGNQWDMAIALLPIISLAVAVGLITRFSGAVAEAMGMLKAKLSIQVLHIVVVAVVVGGTVRYSGSDPRGFALAWLIGEIVRQLLYVFWLQKFLHIPGRHTAVRIREALLLAGAPAAAVVATRRLIAASAPVGLLISGVVAIAALSIVWLAMPHLSVRNEIRDRKIFSTVIGTRRSRVKMGVSDGASGEDTEAAQQTDR